MPITPFHFGPGVFVKSFLVKRFSLRIFIFTQIVTDLEVVYFIAIDQWHHLHRFFHTYLGATVVAVFCIALGIPLCKFGTYIWNKIFYSSKILDMPITYISGSTAAFLGSYSHVFLDSIMHQDIQPWTPFNGNNSMLHFLNYEQLHLLCVGMGILGILILKVRIKNSSEAVGIKNKKI